MHNKFCIIDNKIMKGSFNFSDCSATLNYENITNEKKSLHLTKQAEKAFPYHSNFCRFQYARPEMFICGGLGTNQAARENLHVRDDVCATHLTCATNVTDSAFQGKAKRVHAGDDTTVARRRDRESAEERVPDRRRQVLHRGAL